MRIIRTQPFKEDFIFLPKEIKERANKALRLLVSDFRYPSLQIKKMQDPRDILEARVTDNYRFTFQIKGDTYILRRIGTHNILRNP
ncbi:MAG: hypothetical protein ABIF11_10205 [Nitrospirota bacterium]